MPDIEAFPTTPVDELAGAYLKIGSSAYNQEVFRQAIEVRAVVAALHSAEASEAAAKAARDTARWTRLLAMATFVLAVVTVIATIVSAIN